MRTLRLFRSRQPVVKHSEPIGLWPLDKPCAHGRGVDADADDGLHVATGYAAGDDMRGENAVFGLIDTVGTGLALAQLPRGQPREPGANQAVREPGVPDDGSQDLNRDVIQALHDQYWRALDNPQTSLAEDWAAHTGLEGGSGH